MSFRLALEFGDKWQSTWLQQHGCDNATVMEGNFSFYDAIIEGERYEFKAERLIEKYGNICIEYACTGKPSGISVTAADYYVVMSIVDNKINEWWKIPVSVIKEKIEAREYHRDTKGGNGHAAQMYLFRKDVFAAWKGV